MKKIALVFATVLLAAFGVVYYGFPGVVLDAAMRAERGVAHLTEKSVQVGDHRIVYLEGGAGEPIVLVHGFAADKDNWTRFAKYLTPHYHVIALDLPGFGMSSRIPTASYDITSQTVRLNQFVDALGLKKFHLVGNSMGGQLAAAYASDFTDRVESLGLFANAGIRSPRESELARLVAQGKNPLLVSSPADYDAMLKFVFVSQPMIPGAVKTYFTEQAIRNRDFNDKVWKDLRARPMFLENRLGRILAPTLILWGDTDRLLDVSSVEVLQKGIPHNTAVIMKDCGHAPMIERPDETAKHYQDFLSSL